jgi:hypothetical protein
LLAAIVGAIVLAKTPAMSGQPPEQDAPSPNGSGNGNGASGPALEEPVETVGAPHGGHGH